MIGIIFWFIILAFIAISTCPEIIYLLLLEVVFGFLLLDVDGLKYVVKKYSKKILRKIRKS